MSASELCTVTRFVCRQNALSAGLTLSHYKWSPTPKGPFWCRGRKRPTFMHRMSKGQWDVSNDCRSGHSPKRCQKVSNTGVARIFQTRMKNVVALDANEPLTLDPNKFLVNVAPCACATAFFVSPILRPLHKQHCWVCSSGKPVDIKDKYPWSGPSFVWER